MYAKTLKGFSHDILIEGRSLDNKPVHVIKKSFYILYDDSGVFSHLRSLDNVPHHVINNNKVSIYALIESVRVSLMQFHLPVSHDNVPVLSLRPEKELFGEQEDSSAKNDYD